MRDFHPASRLILWGWLVVATQLARGPLLWGFGFFIGALALVTSSRRAWMLVRRVRYLLLAVIVLFGFSTPGEVALPLLGQASPSIEGLSLALTHSMRLLVTVMLVAILLEYLDGPLLIAGLIAVARPLALLGLSSERLAVRLMLVLRYAQEPPPGGWRALLVAGTDRDDEVLALPRATIAWWDWIVIVTVTLLGTYGVFL